MAPRRKKIENNDLPVGLTTKLVRGSKRFKYRYISGKEFYFPPKTKRIEAIEAAKLFNAEHRNRTINLLENADKYNRPLAYWIPIVKVRVQQEENLKENAWSTFSNDCERLLSFGGSAYSKSLDLEFVTEYMVKHTSGKSVNVYNRKLRFLRKIFSYLLDEGAIKHNYAWDKRTKKNTSKKIRQRLQLEALLKMHSAAELWLKTAIELGLETAQATLEVSRMKYSDCTWFDTPKIENGLTIYGFIRVRRQKTEHLEASNVEIPITAALRSTIFNSGKDGIEGPYIVHRIGRYKAQIGENCDHHTQVASTYLSSAFSKLRDELGLYSVLPKKARPTFHEVRALAARMFKDGGIDPQERLAHSDAKSTKIYTENHVEWTRVIAAELDVFDV
ncbi:tyrosine-type recombinase/integrase [Aliiglaciecola sp. M165]|uniref:tyrosine-type recombinase/integrase n=1 Tax=Aliiglaciecola sp. M165 TaxID=2593649 RepID=UPI00117DAC47|nr:tyrosine-type recombinase/integrase [Aliiglaciecola sp. M165]TRY29769.1 tyrosine-type recombinase/integrase [Aliiglaciecola sp. M165]